MLAVTPSLPFGACPHRPIGHLVCARVLGKFFTDGAEMLAEDVGSTAAIGSHDYVDEIVGKLDSGIRLER